MSEESKIGRSTTVHLTNTQRVQNPFSGMDNRDVMEDAALLAAGHGLVSVQRDFKLGALIARATLGSSDGFERLSSIDGDLKEALRYEIRKPYRSLPLTQFLLAALCAGCAIVQGMDQTIINGAQVSNVAGRDERIISRPFFFFFSSFLFYKALKDVRTRTIISETLRSRTRLSRGSSTARRTSSRPSAGRRSTSSSTRTSGGEAPWPLAASSPS